MDFILARTGVDLVIAAPGVDRVTAAARCDSVVAVASLDDVVGVTRRDGVVAVLTIHHTAADGPQRVAAVAAVECVRPPTAHERVVAIVSDCLHPQRDGRGIEQVIADAAGELDLADL
jgi:hypothetical protein